LNLDEFVDHYLFFKKKNVSIAGSDSVLDEISHNDVLEVNVGIPRCLIFNIY